MNKRLTVAEEWIPRFLVDVDCKLSREVESASSEEVYPLNFTRLEIQ